MSEDGTGVRSARPGWAAERTELAWRRSGLALLVVGLVVGRLSVLGVGPVALVPVGLGVACAGWVVVASLRRRQAGAPLPDGRLVAWVAAAVLLLCVGELASLLS